MNNERETGEAIIECEHVSKTFLAPEGEIAILKDVSLCAYSAESIAIIGASGSGKTTLLSLLAGLDLATSGTVMLQGQSLAALDEDGRALLRNRHIGFVFQSFHLLPGFTTLENVMLPLEISRRTDAEQTALNMLERVGMSHRLHHYPDTLSGGEQQRVAIARAFAASPPLVLADEPTGSLDAETGARIIDLLFEVNAAQRTTLILVTHDSVLSQRCQRCYLLQQGRLCAIALQSEPVG